MSYLHCLIKVDIIINLIDILSVGGGSAASIIAARLSANPKINVLVLEAGGIKPGVLNIPATGPFLQLSDFDWQFKTVPQENACKALKDQVRNSF